MPETVVGLRVPLPFRGAKEATATTAGLPRRAWQAIAVVGAAVMTLPLAAVGWLAAGNDGGVWAHLSATVLPGYVATTLWLLLGVGLGTLVVGVSTAWLVTIYRFPGRRIVEWALILPLAAPAYIVAYVYTDLLEYSGPLQAGLRALTGWTSRRDYWFPDIRSLGGAIAVMTLVFYPYVYLLARATFVTQSGSVLEAARILGCSAGAAFRLVALPLARPAVAAGAALAMMEALNDFGTVDYFAVATLTAGVYDVWMNIGSSAGAAQLALAMLAMALVLLIGERVSRRRQQFYQTTGHHRRVAVQPLTGWRGVAALAACAMPPLLGFAIPTFVLATHALPRIAVPNAASLAAAGNSLLLAVLTAVIAVVVGLLLATAARATASLAVAGLVRVASVGYAVPGAVLAVGVLTALTTIDNGVDGWARSVLGIATGLLISGSIAALLYGYLARFLALSVGSVDAGLARITPSMSEAARTLGCRPRQVLLRVHLPLLRGSLLAAALLVLVDTLKELPITVLLRPFNFETLATLVYQSAAHERFAEGAPGALLIIAAGCGPVVLLARMLDRGWPEAGV